VSKATPPLLLSPFVLAELDYLVSRHVGSVAQIAAPLPCVAPGVEGVSGCCRSTAKAAFVRAQKGTGQAWRYTKLVIPKFANPQ
jgi:hypothetical protein